jgi:hypothetical protein
MPLHEEGCTMKILNTSVVVEQYDVNSGETEQVVSDGELSLSRALGLASDLNRLQTQVGYSPNVRVLVVDLESGERFEVK